MDLDDEVIREVIQLLNVDGGPGIIFVLVFVLASINRKFRDFWNW